MTPAEHAKAPTLSEVHAFLNGSGELDGCWFGEKPEYEKGEFWWRSRLQAAIRAGVGAQAVETGLSRHTIATRIQRGWNVDRALGTPVKA